MGIPNFLTLASTLIWECLGPTHVIHGPVPPREPLSFTILGVQHLFLHLGPLRSNTWWVVEMSRPCFEFIQAYSSLIWAKIGTIGLDPIFPQYISTRPNLAPYKPNVYHPSCYIQLKVAPDLPSSCSINSCPYTHLSISNRSSGWYSDSISHFITVVFNFDGVIVFVPFAPLFSKGVNLSNLLLSHYRILELCY